jgi:starch synthase
MNVVMIASEAVPFAKTGGLADVVGALPRALAAEGVNASLIMPFYGKRIDRTSFGIEPVPSPAGDIEVRVGEISIKGKLLTCELTDGVKVYFISQPAFFDREELYQTTAGDYPDNAARFIFFAHAAVEAMIKLGLVPDVVHAHDWQAALVPVYLKSLYREAAAFRNAKSLLTIHNLGYQGLFPRKAMEFTGLPQELFTFDKLEQWGKLAILKGGIAMADAISTVSRGYAREILTHDHGMGLDAALAERSDVLTGILNGIDYTAWDPETDGLLPVRFSAEKMEGKAKCKRALAKAFGIPAGKDPVIGIVSRLATQKGFDILSGAMIDLMERKLRLVVLGTGEERYHLMLIEFAKKYPKRVGIELAFDNRLAHLIEAGSDMFLMPSYYEPCGLNQMISLKYGTIPIARATGGLDDTIDEFDPKRGRGNGFKFDDYSPDALVACVDRAIAAFKKPARWKKIVSNAMACDFSWKRSAKAYRKLYRSISGKR